MGSAKSSIDVDAVLAAVHVIQSAKVALKLNRVEREGESNGSIQEEGLLHTFFLQQVSQCLESDDIHTRQIEVVFANVEGNSVTSLAGWRVVGRRNVAIMQTRPASPVRSYLKNLKPRILSAWNPASSQTLGRFEIRKQQLYGRSFA